MDWTITAFLAGWFVLMYWVLPKLGIPTCLKGSCSVSKSDEAPAPGASQEAREDPTR